jgi:hypothetical protein
VARNQLLAILIVVATATFAIGAAIENSDEGSEPGEPHVEAAESEGEAAEAEPVSEDDETLLGIDAESTPLVVAVVIAVAMLVFAVLDLREVFHQADEANAGLAALAAAVAALHLGAAGLAFSLSRSKPA